MIIQTEVERRDTDIAARDAAWKAWEAVVNARNTAWDTEWHAWVEAKEEQS
jgi:hypothetical protein